MTRSPAQQAASRQTGAASRGPVTDQCKARSSQNARNHSLRSGELILSIHEDTGAYRTVHLALLDRFCPVDAAEAMLVARMAGALWRQQRADHLESQFWQYLPEGVRDGDPMRMIRVLCDDGTGTRSLATIHRYQAEAGNAFARALKALDQLRRHQPEDPVGTAATPEPAPPLRANRARADRAHRTKPPTAKYTNEPEDDPRLEPDKGHLDWQRRALAALDLHMASPPVADDRDEPS